MSDRELDEAILLSFNEEASEPGSPGEGGGEEQDTSAESSMEGCGEEQDTSGEASLEEHELSLEKGGEEPETSLEEPETTLEKGEENLERSREGPGEASPESSGGPGGQEPETSQEDPLLLRSLPGLTRNMQRFKHTMESLFKKFSKPSENCVDLDLATMKYDTPSGPCKWSWKETPIKPEKNVPVSRVTHPSKANRADNLTLPVNQPSVIDENVAVPRMTNPSKANRVDNLTLPANQTSVIDEVLIEPVSSDINDKTYSIESSDVEENDAAEDIGPDDEQHNLSETKLDLNRTIGPIMNTTVDLTREVNNATVSGRKAECKDMSSFEFQHERLKSVKSPTCRAYVCNPSTSGVSKIQCPGLHETQWIEKDILISDCELSTFSNVEKSEDESSLFEDEELSDSEFSNMSIGAAYPKLIDSFTRYAIAPHTARKVQRSNKCNGWFSIKKRNISNRQMNNSTTLNKLFDTKQEQRFKPFRSERKLSARPIVKLYKSGVFGNAGPEPTSTKLLTVNLQSPMCNKAVGQNTLKPPAYSETTFQSEDAYLKEESVPRYASFKTSMKREKIIDTTFIKLPFVSQNKSLLSIDEKIQVCGSTLTKNTEEPNVSLCNVGVQCDAIDVPHSSNSNTQWRTYPSTYNPLKKIPLKEEENRCTFEQIYRKLCLDKKSESPRFIRRCLISSRLKEMEPSETVNAMMSSPMFTKVKRKSDFHSDHPSAPNVKRARKFTSSDILNYLFNGEHLDPLDHTQHHSTMSSRNHLVTCFINSSPHLQSNMNGRFNLPSQTFLSPGVYLPGDSAYGLVPYLLTPFRNPQSRASIQRSTHKNTCSG